MKTVSEPLVFAIDWGACIRCGACVAVCPLQGGFVSPFDTISVTDVCGVACLVCEKVCPVSAITHRAATSAELVGRPVYQALQRMAPADSDDSTQEQA